ncbi:hypothetical protein ORS3428_29935 [Mesorhizobium sp. ORS 3428]|nr:hypothetical protein ORS3428_30025 [Mesorhizobium sp. ORS 3428]OHV89906.1 hypothetical protein ORS3428_29935 [Mesorhizobium sp. ORS 3428]
MIAACLTATAVFSGSVAGNFVVGPYEGRTRILQWLKTLWETQADQRRHCMMNILVDDLSGLSAVVLASLFLTGAENGLARVIATGFYRFQMANEEGVWRIADIYAGLDTGI